MKRTIRVGQSGSHRWATRNSGRKADVPLPRQQPAKTTRQSGRSLKTRSAVDVAILACIRSRCSGKNIRVPMAMR